MPKDDDKNVTGSFNKAAQKTPQEALLEAVRKTRNSLGLTEAVKSNDWELAGKYLAEGADPMLRSAAAISALFASDAPEAVALCEKLDLKPVLGLGGIPYILAAQQGNLAKVEEGLQTELEATAKSSMLFAALAKGHAAVADKILETLPAQDMEENALFALLRHRPALYESAVTGRKTPPDYIAHFYNACLLKDTGAMDIALQKMVDNKKTLPLYIFYADDFDGGGFNRMLDYTEAVMRSNHLPAIDKFLEHFQRDITPGRQTVISIACTLEKDQPGLLKSVIDNLQPAAHEVSFAVANTQNNPETALFFMQNYPDEVKREPQGVLRALAQVKGDALQKAVEEEGLVLPAADKPRAELLIAAINAENAVAEKWLLQQFAVTPGLLEEMQGNHNYAVIKRAAAIGQEMRFKNDALFWKAVAENDRDIIDAFPRNPPLSTETPWQAHTAIRNVIKRGDFDLMADILKNTDFKNHAIFRLCLGSAPAMQVAFDAGFKPPEKLDSHETGSIAQGDGQESLDWLAKNAGISLEGEIATTALRSALQHNAPGMVEYLLASGASIGADTSYFDYTVNEMTNAETLQTLEKWMTRAEKREAPGLAEDIASGKPLFGGADSPAIQAAYAGKFADIIRRVAQDENFNPAQLVSTKDAYGNTVLDILGAHGRLNDVFAVPALWKEGDAVSFIRDNSSPLYHDQCDFAGLKASLDLLRLQGRGRQDRFKLK